ncbi:MAG TPA: amidase [Candidatus Limnocylindria bacterium]|nr:amidase [Candidatus Limnocylindria bacterium]
MTDPWRLSLEDAAAAVRDRRISPVELTSACLDRIERTEEALGAYITVRAERALAEARAAEREIDAGRWRGPLHGIPLTLKDLFDLAGERTTAGSRLTGDAPAEGDSAVMERLRAAGAVIVGKTNLHEWAFGVTTDNPHFGPTRNPFDLARIPGGSSGGSAAALATGSCFGSIGSDTGGSIRIPASLCGVVGLKPTYGRVSLRGAMPLSWNLDHAGPLARRVRDAAVILGAIAGHDPLDPASEDVTLADPLAAIDDGARGLRVGLVQDAIARADPEVRGAVIAAATVLERAGASVDDAALPRAGELADVQRTLLATDAFAFHRARIASSAHGYGRDVLERLRRGEATTGAEYARARRARDEIRRAFDLLFARVDVLLLPATVSAAPAREGEDAVAAAAKLTALTSPFNLTGLPAVSVPAGTTSGGLPIGAQVVSGRWRELVALRAARQIERELAPEFRWSGLF